jgi:hypothetical protein
MNLPIFSSDSAERGQFLKLFGLLCYYGVPFLLIGEAMAYGKGMIGGWVFLLLIILDVPFLFVVSLALFWFMDRSATGFTKLVYAGGGIPPDPAHSGCESLVARGFYPEAAQAYRAYLAANPADHLARFKLAELCRVHLNDPAAAEQLYLEVRRGNPSPKEERLVSNLLIELYRVTGRRDRQMVELARFAGQWKGTRAGADAARTLKEMKEEMKEQ